MISLALFVGIWTSACIQTQANHQQGFARETYAITEDGEFEYVRQWFNDPTCKEMKATDEEAGTVEVGNKLTGMFIQGEAYEANFISDLGIDLGALAIANKKLKVARGMKGSTMRNTMVGIFEFSKK